MGDCDVYHLGRNLGKYCFDLGRLVDCECKCAVYYVVNRLNAIYQYAYELTVCISRESYGVLASYLDFVRTCDRCRRAKLVVGDSYVNAIHRSAVRNLGAVSYPQTRNAVRCRNILGIYSY